jgi:hypothetical protein
MSRFNAITAILHMDLGAAYNVAGVTGELQFLCNHYRIEYSLDNVTWNPAIWVSGNGVKEIYVNPMDAAKHFNGRYLRITMEQASGADRIDHPDQPGVELARGQVYGLKYIQVWEHTGGGGAVGIQNLDGTQFNSIVWGQRAPGEWMLGSESDVFTDNLGGGSFKEDEGYPVQIVVTFKKVFPINPLYRRTEIRFYRNGLPYGKTYEMETPMGRLSEANQMRLVVGVRSTIFVNDTYPDDLSTLPCNATHKHKLCDVAGVHGLTHSPFFWGSIHNATLIQNALNPEEVAGLYKVVRGGEELGCHCYDACPVGRNRFNRDVDVPCSGQGVCLRNKEGIPLGTGTCECLPGFSGVDAQGKPNCEKHCSELSEWGCCEIDDDCPEGHVCDKNTKACSTDLSKGSSTGFSYY